MTWPFENDTSDIEKKLAKRSLHRERQRNLFAIIALVLTAFMITATFSIGFSYFETYQMQQIRLRKLQTPGQIVRDGKRIKNESMLFVTCPSASIRRYLIARKPSENFVAIPRRAAIHIQRSAPGPPESTPMAVATPTIFPVPMVAESAVHSAAKLDISPLPPFSF